MLYALSHPHKIMRDKSGRKIIIRPFRRSDREGLIDMYIRYPKDKRSLGLPPLTEEGIRAWIDYLLRNGFSIVAEHEGKIVAHIGLVPVNDRILELVIFVHPDYQNNGIGQSMLRYSIEMCRKLGYKGITLLTSRDNIVAIHVFKKVGFEVINDCYDYEMFLRL